MNRKDDFKHKIKVMAPDEIPDKIADAIINYVRAEIQLHFGEIDFKEYGFWRENLRGILREGIELLKKQGRSR